MTDKFTIEDIHKIREENYESTKGMKPDEVIEDTKRQAQEGKRLLEEIRNKSKKASGS